MITRAVLVAALVLTVAVGAAAGAAKPPTDLVAAGATAISVEGDWLTAGAGGVWLSGQHDLIRLDTATGRVVKRIPVPQRPCEASDVGFGSVWTATCRQGGLTRIDPAANRVSGHVALAVPTSVGGEGSIGAGAGAVWLVLDGSSCSACRLARVDPRTLRVLRRIPVRAGASSVRVGYGAVWVVNPNASIVQKVSPRLDRVVRTTRVGPGPRFFAVGEGGVWTLNQGDGSVTRLDPATGVRRATIRAQVSGEGGDMTAGGGWVWARGYGYLLTRIDPRTNRVVERYGPSSGSGAAIVGFGAVWISAHDVRTVWRLPLTKI